MEKTLGWKCRNLMLGFVPGVGTGVDLAAQTAASVEHAVKNKVLKPQGI